MSEQQGRPEARGDADIAAVGALLGDRARCRVLLALDDGRALPASRLAAEAGISPQTASAHLKKLVAGGLLAAESHGRYRYYRLAGPEVGRLIEDLARLAPAEPVRSLRQGTHAARLRAARSCYDHLAGRLGVDLMRAMLDRGQLVGEPREPAEGAEARTGYGHAVDYRLSPAGRTFLAGLGIALPDAAPVRYCIDWSEQRHHLAGLPGRLLLARILELGWLVRDPHGRAVRVTGLGRAALRDRLGIG